MSKLYEAKTPKTYTLIQHRRGKEREIGPHTLEELIKYFSYTLEKGNSWDRKVNRNPKNITALINNLNRAEDAATGNGYSGVSYTLKPESKDSKTDVKKESKSYNILEAKLRRLIQKEIKQSLKENDGASAEEIFNSIDFKPLTAEISKRIGTQVELSYKFKSPDMITITSPNLIKKAGIFKSVISEVYIYASGSRIFVNEDHNTLLTIFVHLNYPGNGMKIFDAWCDKNGKWTFRGEPRSGM